MSDPYAAFPSAPPPSGGWEQPSTDRGPRPSTVNNAFALMMLRVLLSAIGLIITFTNKDEIKDKIRSSSPNLSDSALNSAVTIGIVFALVFLVLYAALGFTVRAGKNWARIVTWVLAGLGIIGGLVTLGQPTIGAERIIGVVQIVLDIALVVLLALKPSNAYFKGRQPGR